MIILLASLVAVGFSKFRQLPMIDYVMAGVIIGPYFLKIIESEAEIRFLAEMGVVLLLFKLGMELPLKSFRESFKVAVPATLLLTGLSVVGIFIISSFIEMTIPEKSFMDSLSR